MYREYKNYKEVFNPIERPEKEQEPIKLQYCDTGKLLELMSSLYNPTSAPLQRKVNRFISSATKGLSFIMGQMSSSSTIRIEAIGTGKIKPFIIQGDSSFIRKIKHLKKPTEYEKCELEGRLLCEIEKILETEFNEEFRRCLVFPVFHPNFDMIPFFVGLVNYEAFWNCEEMYYGIINETFTHCFGVLRGTFRNEEEMAHTKNCKTVLKSLVAILSSVGSEMIYDVIQDEVKKIYGVDKCSVFIQAKNNLIPKIFDIGLNIPKMKLMQLRIPMGEGVAGMVAESGKRIVCRDPQLEPIFPYALEKIAGVSPRNILAFPIVAKAKVKGVIETYDKDGGYTDEDEALTFPIGVICGMSCEIHHKYIKFLDEKRKLRIIDCLFLRRIRKVHDMEIKYVLYCKAEHLYHRYFDARFNTASVPEDHLICSCYQVFNSFGLLEKFQIHKITFIRFLLMLRNGYYELIFHNWRQAFSTFHFVFWIINGLNLVHNKYISTMEAFCLLLAALALGFDYRGPTNQFQLSTGTTLASVFSSPGSVAQHHQRSQFLRLLNFTDCNILENVSEEQYFVIITLLNSMITGADFCLFQRRLDSIKNMIFIGYNFKELKHRKLLHYFILCLALVHDYSKSWEVCRKTGENIFDEFFRKGDLSYAVGVFDLSEEFAEDLMKLPDLQNNFINMICIPFFRLFADLFPTSFRCYKRITDNYELWINEKDVIMAKLAEAFNADEDDE